MHNTASVKYLKQVYALRKITQSRLCNLPPPPTSSPINVTSIGPKKKRLNKFIEAPLLSTAIQVSPLGCLPDTSFLSSSIQQTFPFHTPPPRPTVDAFDAADRADSGMSSALLAIASSPPAPSFDNATSRSQNEAPGFLRLSCRRCRRARMRRSTFAALWVPQYKMNTRRRNTLISSGSSIN